MAFSASTSADGIPEPPRADPPPAGPDLLTEPAIATRGLTRRFGEVLAVDAVDLTVAHGAVFGLLGPDGAGKSTLIRMLATVLLPDAGEARVLGHSTTAEPAAVTGRIGYMSQRFSMYPDLSVAENLDFFATVRGVPKALRRERSAALLEGMGLAEFRARQARHLSGGMKQKLMLATTLMHEPELLLLDEPTTGVDPVSRREFWRVLAGLHRSGTTVVVATPYMDEAERCSHIAFLDGGRIRHHGTPEQIKALVPGTLVEVVGVDPRAAVGALVGLADAGSPHVFGDVVRILWHGPAAAAQTALAAHLAAAGMPSARVRPAHVDMETAFAVLAEAGR
ncbi:MAG: ABC transporter ATP-binding protein [Candidatus Phosphoribacter baldrii]|nr:ABC transporter ATP-binding protein [Dermatophilaceae bacterium]